MSLWLLGIQNLVEKPKLLELNSLLILQQLLLPTTRRMESEDQSNNKCSSRDLSEKGKKSIQKQFGYRLLRLTVQDGWEPEEQVK